MLYFLRMRSLLSLLAAVAALMLFPGRAWAEDHGHCEEPTSVVTAPAEAPSVASPAAELSSHDACDQCPDHSCPSHGHCAAGAPPVIAEASLTQAATPAGSAAGPVTTAGFVVSFNPTPPTPPPNLRTRQTV